MNYLEKLKQENMYKGALSKLPKGGFDSFGSNRWRHISKKTCLNQTAANVEIEIQNSRRTITTSANRRQNSKVVDLPVGCPLDGGPVPDGCGFEARFFARMAKEGILPLPDGQCPIRNACKMKQV